MRLALLLALVPLSAPVSRAPEPPLLRLEARDFTFGATRTVRAGLVRVRLVNKGPAWHEALVTRLGDGATAATYVKAARAGEEFPAGSHDVGGPSVIAPRDSSEAVLRLEPGRYAIVCWHDDHVKAGMILTLVVTPAADSVASPRADGEVALREWAFDHPPLHAGRQLLHVRNTGAKPHEMIVYRLAPGRTVQDFGAWYARHEGPAPALPVGGLSSMMPGRDAWVALSLAPGRYFIACAIPEGEKIHAQLGMLEEFTIAP